MRIWIIIVVLVVLTIILLLAISTQVRAGAISTNSDIGGQVQTFVMTDTNNTDTLNPDTDAYLGTPIVVRDRVNTNRLYYGILNLVLPSEPTDIRPIGSLVNVKNMGTLPQNPNAPIGNAIVLKAAEGVIILGNPIIKAGEMALLVKSNANEYTRLQ
jgi:hypothetical protein